MKVLHVINSLATGGAERLLGFLVPEIAKKENCSVELLVLNESLSNVHEILRDQNVTVHYLRKGGSLYNPNAIAMLKPFFNGNYDIIHGHLFPTQYFLTIAKMLYGSRSLLVFTEHNTSNRRINSPVLSKLDKQMYLGLDHLVCITEEIEQIYLNYQPRLKGRTTVIHNGLPVKDIANHSPIDLQPIVPNFDKADRYILQVAGFREQKDQDSLIRALKYLPSHFKCLFAGDGIRRPLCEEIARSEGVTDRVVFLGNRSDVYSIQKSVDYIVLSTHYEGLSLSCIEGMASGKPFLASDVKGVRNLVGGAGVLFKESDPKDLASKILELEQDDAYREKIVSQCQRRASEYSIEECARKHIELYERLLNEK